MHFPEELTIKSSAPATAATRCSARSATPAHRAHQAQAEGWLAEHMLILGMENPQGETHYVAAAFPSACGKTNLADADSAGGLSQGRLEGVDHRRRHLLDASGPTAACTRSIPEAGFFGVAPGTSINSNPNALKTVAHDTIFTNVASPPTTSRGGKA
jgi:phosphoenolpyruvate carboxykinase (GTP)